MATGVAAGACDTVAVEFSGAGLTVGAFVVGAALGVPETPALHPATTSASTAIVIVKHFMAHRLCLRDARILVRPVSPSILLRGGLRPVPPSGSARCPGRS